MRSPMIQARLRLALAAIFAALGVFAAPTARADNADLLAAIERAGGRVVTVAPGDARLRGGLGTGIGADGKAEVYIPSGGSEARTPLKTPTERMSLSEFRELTEDIRREVKRVTGVDVGPGKVVIAGSSSGIPFLAPDGELRSFDRKGPGTSDFDGALISEALFNYIKERAPRSIRGKTTGARTSPDPLPELKQAFDALSAKWGRHVAAMVYENQAEFEKRMQLTNMTIGKNVMPEALPEVTRVELTRPELLGALIEAEAMKTLVAQQGAEAARQTYERARQGSGDAAETLRKLRSEAAVRVQGSMTGLSEADAATLRVEAARLEARSQGFGPVRPGEAGPVQPSRISETEVRSLFENLRSDATSRARERLAELNPSERATFSSLAERAGRSQLEILSSNELVARYDASTNKVTVSTGLLNKIDAARPAGASPDFRSKALSLILGHELAHSYGVTAERAADFEAIKVAGARGGLSPADVRETVRLFEPSGTRLSEVFTRLREVATYGTFRGREAALERALAGAPDSFARYRNGDGTLRWREITRDGALRQASGVAHFGLALFLKELAVVVQTGDRLRIEEFFDGIATTDFFVTYGLFTAGAQAGSVAYDRYLQRYIKPQFVGGILKTNIVLATGMALPEIVRGHFDGKVFAINLASLGLSSMLVQGGLRSIPWVLNLKSAEDAALLQRFARLRGLAKAGGWLYTAAETAVVLYVGDELAQAAQKYLDEKAAREAVGQGSQNFFETLGRGPLSDEALAAALDSVEKSHDEYRNSLYRDLAVAEQRYLDRLQRAATMGKRLADKERSLADAIAKNPALAELIAKRPGGIEEYVRKQVAEEGARIEAFVREAMETYERERQAGLAKVYSTGRRSGEPYAAHEDLLWAARGAPVGGAGDPLNGRSDIFARFFRGRSQSAATGSLREISGNRLQAYDDEIALLNRAKALVPASQRKLIDDRIARIQATQRLDENLAGGAKAVNSRGARGALSEMTGPR